MAMRITSYSLPNAPTPVVLEELCNFERQGRQRLISTAIPKTARKMTALAGRILLPKFG